MRLAAASALFALLSTACEPDEPRLRATGRTETDEARPRDEDEDRDDDADEGSGDDDAPRERASCTLEAPRVLGTEPSAGVAVATSEHGTVVVLEAADGPFVALAPGEDGTVRREIPRARGESIFALEPAGERFLLVGRAPCTRGGIATICLVARSIAADDLGPSAPVDVALPGPMRTRRTYATGSLLYVARSHTAAPPGLERFEVADDGTVTATRRTFGEAVPEDEPVEILGLTADGAGWAVVYRHGATEDSESGVVLATQLDEHEVGGLDEALLVEAMAWVGTSLAMIVAFEFARPSWVRMGADGELEAEPAALPPGEVPPYPFAGIRTTRIGGDAEARTLEVRDALGDRVGSTLTLGPGAAAAAASDTGFVVATLAPGGELSLRDVRCP